MKLLDSKFYTPVKVFEEIEIGGTYTFTVKDFLEKVSNSDDPYRDLLDRMMPAIYLNNTEMVIRKEQLEDFKKCTDFHTVSYNSKKQAFYVSEACYFHPEYEIFILTNDNLTSEYDEFIVDSGMSRVIRVYYDSSNPKSPENVEKLFGKYLQKYISKDAKISIMMKEGDSFSFKNHKIHPYSINLDTMYNEDFLPVHEKMKDDLTNTHKGVILLHGIAGSGKTNYIKWMTSQIPEKSFIFVPNNMIQMLTDPAFINLLVGKKNSVIVLEDCENYIAERSTSGSQTDVVASILNIADGILSDVLECQFICTFNAKLTKIDHALLRKGRLIAEYNFGKLSVEKCNAYLKSVGKSLEVKEPYSLAELVHIDEEDFTAPQDKGIGFR